MINHVKQLFQGPKLLISGFKLIFTKGYKKLFLFPILLNTLLFVGLFYSLGQFAMAGYHQLIGDHTWADFWLLKLMLWGMVLIVGFFVINTCFVFCVNLIAIPFHTKIAEKVMKDNDQRIHPQPNLWVDIKQTIKRELSKNLYFLPRLGIGLIIFLIPGINLLAPLLWLYLISWILGLQALDYAAELQQISWKNTLIHSKKYPLLVMSFGLLQCFIVTIPIANLLTPPAAVAGGCFLWRQISKSMHVNEGIVT